MKRFAWLAGALLPVVAMAAGAAPGPDWAFMTPDPSAPPSVRSIITAGTGDPLRTCGACHLPSGMGQPESANLRGQNADYLARQMADFKSGVRGGPLAGPMAAIAKGLTDAEVQQVAAYYAGLKPAKWTTVSEAATAPKTIVGGTNQRTKLPGSDMEPVGKRIVEVATSGAAVQQANGPAFVAYVPPGSLAIGKNIVTTGAGGKTEACIGCHGDDMKGADDVPALAGRSPVYIARQIYSFKNGVRKGPFADVMKDVVGKLSDDEVIGAASYIASLDPS